jgi:hypothetical protein
MKRTVAIFCVLVCAFHFSSVSADHAMYSFGRHYGPTQPNDPCNLISPKANLLAMPQGVAKILPGQKSIFASLFVDELHFFFPKTSFVLRDQGLSSDGWISSAERF